ncbi:MAG: low temperature requirement protein A [Actinomycetales bacterium]|nr:low temperature requirement protein A [Actinomycetales bacterium]
MSEGVSGQESSGQRVIWFELFYDLIIVAAVALVGKVFIKSPDWNTTFLVVTSLLVLFAIWLLTTLSHSLFPANDPVRMLLVLVQMMLLSISVLSLGKTGLPTWSGFAAAGAAFLTITLIFARHARRAASLAPVARSIVIVSASGAGLLCVSGLLSAWLTSRQSSQLAPVLIVIALVALLIPMTTVVVTKVASSGGLDPHHLQERFGLFVIIVLGESFVGLLASLGNVGSIPSPPFFILTFIVAFSIWSIYFSAVIPHGFPRTPNRLRSWMLGHALLVLSIVAVAVEFADLTLEEYGQSLVAPHGTWTAMPMLGVMTAITILSYALPTCPQAMRRLQAATAAILLMLTVADYVIADLPANASGLAGGLLLAADAAATAIVARRSTARA